MSIASQKVAIKGFEAFIHEAEALAKEHGKTVDAKRPILTSHLALTLRNRDENSRDTSGSVNSIQVAMDIAVAAAGRGLACVCYKTEECLRLQIAPAIKGGE